MFSHFSKVFTVLTLLSVAPFTASVAQEAPLKIAVVSIEQVLSQATAARSIAEQVKQRRETYRSEIQAEENALREANQALAQKRTLLDAAAFQEERRKLELQVRNVQKKVQQRNAQLQEAQRTATQQVMTALRKVVFDLSVEKGYNLVLRNAQTLIVHESMDITEDVIQGLDTALPNVTLIAQ